MARMSKQMARDAARATVPSFGVCFFDAAMAGDPDAARSLSFRLSDYQRPLLARYMYLARVPALSFKEVLRTAITQTHRHNDVLHQAGGRAGLDRWLGYAGFEPPPGSEDIVRVYRGASGIPAYKVKFGLSWTTNFDVAAWFACRSGLDAGPVVIEMDVPRQQVCWIGDARNEAEVVMRGPHFRRWRQIDDPDHIAAGYAAQKSRIEETR